MIARRIVILCGAWMLPDGTASGAAAPQPGALGRAVACGIDQREIAGIMAALAVADTGMKTPVRRFAMPTGNLYQLMQPISAMGYTTRDIYVSPGRIAMVVSGSRPADVAARLHLAPVPYSPFERRIDGVRKIIAYQLHQDMLADKVLFGCEYSDPDARAWIDADDAGF